MPKEGRSAPPATPRATASPAPASPAPLYWSAVLASLLLLIYLLLTPHATADEDAAELTLALVTGGVIHPTGYPVFTIFGHAFVALLRMLGVGYAFAANAWAALGGALALFFLQRLGLRLIRGGPALAESRRFWIATVPILVLALNPQWSAECTIIEVHSWHLAWLCGTALYFTILIQDLQGGGKPLRLTRRMLVFGFLCGLGGAHHTTAAFYAAAFAAGLVWALLRARSWSWRIPLLWLAGGLLPMLSYLYIYLRTVHPGSAWIWPTCEPTLRGLWDHVSGSLYRGYLGRWNPDATQAADLAKDVYPFLWPALALFTLWLIWAKSFADRVLRGALLAGSLLQLVFIYHYGVPDPISYFLPPLALSLLVLAGMGRAIQGWMSRRSSGRSGARLVLALVSLGLLLALRVWGIGAADARQKDVVHYDEIIRRMWKAVPYEHCIFLWPSDMYCKLKLYQQLEGDKPGCEVYNTGMLCHPYPEQQFTRKYGFDPLVNNGPEHVHDVIDPRFITEKHAAFDPRFLGRVNMTIADSARVPVLLFDDQKMELRRLNRRGEGG